MYQFISREDCVCAVRRRGAAALKCPKGDRHHLLMNGPMGHNWKIEL